MINRISGIRTASVANNPYNKNKNIKNRNEVSFGVKLSPDITDKLLIAEHILTQQDLENLERLLKHPFKGTLDYQVDQDCWPMLGLFGNKVKVEIGHNIISRKEYAECIYALGEPIKGEEGKIKFDKVLQKAVQLRRQEQAEAKAAKPNKVQLAELLNRYNK